MPGASVPTRASRRGPKFCRLDPNGGLAGAMGDATKETESHLLIH